ncbi:MAG: hypothetical protein IKP67_00365 [Spirochaetales bacterium]|nr:hypothetical protein [Spirochaetales bacterium]
MLNGEKLALMSPRPQWTLGRDAERAAIRMCTPLQRSIKRRFLRFAVLQSK